VAQTCSGSFGRLNLVVQLYSAALLHVRKLAM